MRRRRDPERMARKNEIAEVNRTARESRTPEQQLAVLDTRLGIEMGASRERSRLIDEIENRLNAKKNFKDTSSVTQNTPKKRSDRRKEKAKRYAEKQQRRP